MMKTIFRIFILALLASTAFSCQQPAASLPADYSAANHPCSNASDDTAPVTDLRSQPGQDN